MKAIRISIGVLLWLAAVGWLVAWLTGDRQHVRDAWAPQLWNYATGKRHDVALELKPGTQVAAREPVFLQLPDGKFQQVGEVQLRNSPRDSTNASEHLVAEALLYADAPALERIDRLTAYETPDSMQWVVETMLPWEKRKLIIAELTKTFEEHHDEVIAELRPMIEASLRDALNVVQDELPATLARHQDELQKIGARYQRDLVQREIVPLVKEEVWPIVQREAEPAATEIGHEIWQRASLWRFGWRFVYDRSPLPEKNLVKEEWARFLNQDVVPVLEEHTDELIEIQQRILADVARNEEVQRVIRENVAKIVSDRELQRVVGQVIRELFVNNPRIREVLDRHWRSPDAHALYQRISSKLEPTVTRIGEILIGTPEGGITPEFARVLRNRILHKEQRWLIVELRDSPLSDVDRTSLAVHPGPAPDHNPFVPEIPELR